jgi:hypothetical protein
MGLHGACFVGHKELVKFMIARGANDWNMGLENACCGGHKELIELMRSHMEQPSVWRAENPWSII